MPQEAKLFQVDGNPCSRRAEGEANSQTEFPGGVQIGDDSGERRNDAKLGTEARSDLLADRFAVNDSPELCLQVSVGVEEVPGAGRLPDRRDPAPRRAAGAIRPAGALEGLSGAAALRAVAVAEVRPAGVILEAVFDRLDTTTRHRFDALGLPGSHAAKLLLFWVGYSSALTPSPITRLTTRPL